MIKQIITDASPKSCDLDPAPTWLVAESVDELLPMLSRIITASLHSSTVPDKLKIGYISPLIKKPGSNIKFTAKPSTSAKPVIYFESC